MSDPESAVQYKPAQVMHRDRSVDMLTTQRRRMFFCSSFTDLSTAGLAHFLRRRLTKSSLPSAELFFDDLSVRNVPTARSNSAIRSITVRRCSFVGFNLGQKGVRRTNALDYYTSCAFVFVVLCFLILACIILMKSRVTVFCC